MVTRPGARACTRPVGPTVTTDGVSELHVPPVTVASEPSEKKALAMSVWDAPTNMKWSSPKMLRLSSEGEGAVGAQAERQATSPSAAGWRRDRPRIDRPSQEGTEPEERLYQLRVRYGRVRRVAQTRVMAMVEGRA